MTDTLWRARSKGRTRGVLIGEDAVALQILLGDCLGRWGDPLGDFATRHLVSWKDVVLRAIDSTEFFQGRGPWDKFYLKYARLMGVHDHA